MTKLIKPEGYHTDFHKNDSVWTRAKHHVSSHAFTYVFMGASLGYAALSGFSASNGSANLAVASALLAPTFMIAAFFSVRSEVANRAKEKPPKCFTLNNTFGKKRRELFGTRRQILTAALGARKQGLAAAFNRFLNPTPIPAP